MGAYILFLMFLIGSLAVAVGYVLGISSLIMAVIFWDSNTLIVLSRRMFSGCDGFILLVMPLFVLAGEIMNKTGITNGLIQFANVIVGRLRGGLAQVNILASILFAGLTGAAMSDTAALGSVLIPSMVKEGYKRSFSAAITAASSIIGPIIPPSGIMIIYAYLMQESVAALFLAGAVPGFLMGGILMVFTAVIAKKRNFPKKEEKVSMKDVLSAFVKAVPALIAPIIIIGGILTGVCTATEAAALAVFYAFILGFFFYRNLKLSAIWPMLYKTTLTTATIMLIMATAAQLQYLITDVQLPQQIADFITSLTQNKYLFLFFMNIFVLIMGMIMEILPNVVLLGPILAPIAIEFGVHPLHFATILIVNVNVGMITPPLGEIVFVASSVGRSKVEKVMREIVPFIVAEILVIFLVTYFPQISLWLPSLFGYVK